MNCLTLFRYLAQPMLLCFLLVSFACSGDDSAGNQGWLSGSVDEQLDLVERQLRGFDMAMVETGYRFTELYFAGQDENWPYAQYQIEKLEHAIRLGLERRPARAESAQPFLEEDIPAVQEAIEAEDSALFLTRMERLRSGCMRCHTSEDVPYFTVEFPERRLTPIRSSGETEDRE